jgi:iron complex transport system substrate-binding protein
MTAPSRIVSLLPSATEILFAIGVGDRVVGVTHECDYPDAARHLPKVTSNAVIADGETAADIDRHIHAARHAGSSIYRLDERVLRDLRPDLIVTQELCDVCAVAYSEVQRAVRRLSGDIPILSLEPRSLDDICASVEEVGAATGCQQGADLVAAEMRRTIATVGDLPGPEPRPRVVCVEWTDPIMVGGHWVPEMVRIAGGVDALGIAGEPSRHAEWSEVSAAHPDVMVLMPCGFNLEQTVALVPDVTSRPGFDALACAKSGRVFAVDGSAYFNRPGPRITRGLEILAAALRARPGDPVPAGAAYCWNQPAMSRMALIEPEAL